MTCSGMEITGINMNSGLDLISLGVKTVIDTVRGSPQCDSYIATAARISYAGKPDVLLDGEPLEMDAPLTLKLVPKGVRVLAPERPDGETLEDVVV